MTRGALIWPFKAVLAPLDVAATTVGANHLFGDVPERVEVESTDYITLTVQVETGATLESGRQRQRPGGNDPVIEMRLVVHFQQLEDDGLVGPDGAALIPDNHRLVRILTVDDELVREYPEAGQPGALYSVLKPLDSSFGLSGLQRNLLLLEYATRDKGTNRVS